MYMGQIDIRDRGRYVVNYPRPRHLRMVSDYPGDDIWGLDGLGIFGGKKKKRRRAEAAARELRIANLEKLALARMAPVPGPAPITPPPTPVATVAVPISPAPVITAPVPARDMAAKAGLPPWAVPAGIGGALLLVAVIVLPQMKKAK